MRSLTQWTPRNRLAASEPFRALEDWMDDLWNNWPTRLWSDTAQPMLRPAMDLVENEHAFVIRVDLPGIAPEDVNVEVENDMLTVSGEVGDTIEKEGDRYHYRERTYGSFQRSVRLPNTIETDKVEASFENGVLNITLPKLPEAKPKQITVKTTKS